ncbi:hypothetical protein EDD15DRAFT_2198070 [Pisolithus albus]|nr:hypothetical protein EDD15DRAFT_2198070 [Pisolithus albus]
MRRAFSKADKIVMESGVWLVRFPDLNFIQQHKDQPFIKTTLAGNQLLPTHTNSENDSFNTMMNVLLQMPLADSWHKYIDTTLATVRSVLQDKDMFDTLFDLCLSMHSMAKWYPTYICQVHASHCQASNPHLGLSGCHSGVQDVSKGIPVAKLPAAFEAEYHCPAPKSRSPSLNMLAKCLMPSLFRLDRPTHKPLSQRGRFQSNGILWHPQGIPSCNATRESDLISDVIRASMSAKFKVLKYGLMHHLHPDGLLDQFLIPTKIFLYALSKQFNHVCEGIMEVIGKHILWAC